MLAIITNYLIGTNYMYFAFKYWDAAPDEFSYTMAWSWMVSYFPLDFAVTALSLGLVPRLQKTLKQKPVRNQSAI